MFSREFFLCFENTVLCTGSQKETISTFVPPLFNGLWPFNKATRFTGGRLLNGALQRKYRIKHYITG
jgi:hypothetical protein